MFRTIAALFAAVLVAGLHRRHRAAQARHEGRRRHADQRHRDDAVRLRQGRRRQERLQRALRRQLAAIDGGRNAAAAGDWTIVVRNDGSKQWAYKGKPLYTWSKDMKPGDKTGDGIKSVWHVAKD